MLDASDYSEFSLILEGFEKISSENEDVSEATDDEASVFYFCHLLIRLLKSRTGACIILMKSISP